MAKKVRISINNTNQDMFTRKERKGLVSKEKNTKFIISLIFNIVLVIFLIFGYLYMDDKVKENKNVADANLDLINELSLNEMTQYDSNKLEFFDENIVFTIEGYGNYYYSYDCVQKIVDGEYSFRAYNKEAAISSGYKAGGCQ